MDSLVDPHRLFIHLSKRGCYITMKMREFHTSTPKELATMILDCFLAKKNMEKMLEFIIDLSHYGYTLGDAVEALEYAFPQDEKPIWRCSLSRYKHTDRKVILIMASPGDKPVEVLCVTYTPANPYMFVV